jgi:hypothetical protein
MIIDPPAREERGLNPTFTKNGTKRLRGHQKHLSYNRKLSGIPGMVPAGWRL